MAWSDSPVARIISPSPGISRSITPRVASGRDIAQRNASAARSENGAHLTAIGEGNQFFPDMPECRRRLPLSPRTRQPSCSRRAWTAGPGAIRALSRGNGIADRKDRHGFHFAALPPVVAALAAGLFEQVQVLDVDGFIERLGHVVDRQRGNRGSRERLHFDAGLAGGGGTGDDAHAVCFDLTSTSAWESISGWQSGISSDVFLAAAIPAMRAISSGLPLGFSGSFASTSGCIRTKAWARAVRLVAGFGRNIHHARAAGGIVVRELFHFSSTRISSPAFHSARSGSATRNALARVERRHIARAAPGHGSQLRLCAGPSDDGGQEARQPGFVAEIAREARQEQWQLGTSSAPASSSSAARANNLESHHGGCGIAGQTEEESVPRAAEDQRLAGLDEHAIEEELRAEFRPARARRCRTCRPKRRRKSAADPPEDRVRSGARVSSSSSRATGRIIGTPPARVTCAASE